MKKIALLLLLALVVSSCGKHKKAKQAPQETSTKEVTTKTKTSPQNPWTAEQLMPASVLAQKIETQQLGSTVVLSIGFENVIKNSIDLGPASDAKGLENLKKYLTDQPKDKSIVIYCGCCPMDVCPNIRPAFALLNQMGFTNAKLLEIPTSVKADWLDKGYPTK